MFSGLRGATSELKPYFFGTYGKSDFLKLPYRTDKGNAQASFYTFGKIDNSDFGYLAENKKMTRPQMLKKWNALKDKDKRRVLFEQLVKEAKRIKTRLKDHYVYNAHPPLIEIANEPNLFPYLSPKTYAWYYHMWVKTIKKVVPDAEFMNGGLWCTDVIPKQIRKALPLIGVKENDSAQYYREFIKSLPDSSVAPDIMNLHIYPLLYKNNTAKTLINGIELLKTPLSSKAYVTEYGNINPLSMRDTAQFVKEMNEALLSNNDKIAKAFYFQTRFSRSDFGFLYDLNKVLQAQPKYKKVLNIFRRVLNKKSSLAYLMTDYIKRPPIQYLESDGALNLIGKVFKEFE